MCTESLSTFTIQSSVLQANHFRGSDTVTLKAERNGEALIKWNIAMFNVHIALVQQHYRQNNERISRPFNLLILHHIFEYSSSTKCELTTEADTFFHTEQQANPKTIINSPIASAVFALLTSSLWAK